MNFMVLLQQLIQIKYPLILIWILMSIPVCIRATSKIEIPASKEWKITLVNELEVMVDEQKEWTYERILQSSSPLFSPNKATERPKFHTYWAKVILVNPNANDESLSLESNYWDYVSIYIMDSAKQILMLNLGILNKKQNSMFVIPRHSEVLLLAKFESTGSFRRETNINLVISKTIPHLESNAFSNYMDGIIFGIMLSLALYNFFLYISLRDTTYFWYTIYIFLFAITYITLFISSPSKLTQYFIPSSPNVAFYIKKIGDGFLWIAYTQFTRHFLQSKIRLPGWDLILKILIGLMVLQFLINFFGIYHFT